MKSKEIFVVKVLRFLKSQLDAAAKDKLADLTDGEAIKVIQRRIKQSQEAKEQYSAGHREDLVAAEQAEIDLVSTFLPQQLSAEELTQLVARTISKLQANSPRDFGRVMKQVMEEVSGRAEGRVVKETVEELLRKP